MKMDTEIQTSKSISKRKKIKEFFLLMKLINVGFNIFGYE